MVRSRIGLEHPCIYFHEMQQMPDEELQKYACIIVDEAQFLTKEEVYYLVHLVDDCGIRVICSYVQDVYTIANLLVSQDDVHLVRMADYIREPKPNGYRSLHLIVEIPVFLSEGRILVPVEVQIRTIAMDFWASLEHSLRYKAQEYIPQHISDELQRVATDIASLDQRMQAIHDQVDELSDAHGDSAT